MFFTDCFLLNGLSESEKSEALSFFDAPKTFKKSEELYKNGYIGVLTEGTASVKRNTKNGECTVMRTMKKGEIFGAASVFGKWNEGMSSITAVTACCICYIDEEKFKTMLKKFSRISFNYIAFLTEKLRFLNFKIDAFTADSTESRLYEYLTGIAVDNTAKLDYSMSELARRLKVGRSSLYRDIASLENSGLIERKGNTFFINNF